MSAVPFEDRIDAGLRLAERLREFGGSPETLVLALPRGGVVVGAEVARRLGAPLDVILVDDGLATGATMRAAAAVIRAQGPKRLVVAVPVAPAPTCETLGDVADEVICLATPENFRAVGEWYEDFSQTSDEEVRRLLGTDAPGV